MLLFLAQANEAIMRTRNEVQAEAFQYIEQVRNDLRREAIQFSQQVASQASMESRAQVAETQLQASQLVDSARLEVEGIRNQAREEVARAHQELECTQLELMNLRKEAQIHVSTLEGKISELVHMNSMLTKKVEEQSCLVETLLKRVDDQCVVISSLRTSLNTTVIDSNRAGVGVGDPRNASEGPPVFSIATPQGGLPSASAGPNRLLLPHSTSVIPNQDLHSAAASELPLGTAGGAPGSGYDSQSGMPQSRKDLEMLIKQLMTGHQSSNKALPATVVSPQAERGPPNSPSSSFSSSSSRGSKPASFSGALRNGGGGNSPQSSRGSAVISNAQSSDPYKAEKKLMRVKHSDTMKFPALPKSAAEARPFRNSVFNVVCKFAKTDETPVFVWI